MRFAVVDVFRELEASLLLGKAELVLQIHDELILEVEESAVEETSVIVKNCMENILKKYSALQVLPATHVPLLVSIKKGTTLGDLS